LYAEKHPDKVKVLAPISTVVSGAFSVSTSKHQEIAAEWQKKGWTEKKSASKPGVIKRLKWSHIEDRLKYDLLPQVAKLTMPVLMIVGENDDSTPVEHQQILFNALVGSKELHIIKGAPHTFREQSHLDEIYQIFDQWIKNKIK
jgi:pimeloyl-ACP methyl ester carboxylesterase